jgi:hypothetical protein
MSAFECWCSSQGDSRARSNAVLPSLLRADGSAHSASKTANDHRTNRLSDRRLAITLSRISSGSIDMPPSGVTRRDFRLLRAAMNARSLACSRPDPLSRQKNSIHRRNKFIPLSIGVETWNAFSLMGRNVVSFRSAHHWAAANDLGSPSLSDGHRYAEP